MRLDSEEAGEKETRKKVAPGGAENVTEEEVASSQSPTLEEEEDGPSASYWQLLKEIKKSGQHRGVETAAACATYLNQDRKENCSKPDHPPDPPDDHPPPLQRT